MDVVRVSIPMILYFAYYFSLAIRLVLIIKGTVSISMITSSNNFEIAIAVAVGVFGIESKEAFTAVIGPLFEVPVMIVIVNIIHNETGFRMAAVPKIRKVYY